MCGPGGRAGSRQGTRDGRKGSPGEGGHVAGTCWGAAPGALQCTPDSLPPPWAHLGSWNRTLSRVLSPRVLAPRWALGLRAEHCLLAVPIWHGTAGAPACSQWSGRECSQCRQDTAPQEQKCGQGQLPELSPAGCLARGRSTAGVSTTARKGTQPFPELIPPPAQPFMSW